jgi:hypothetical protein
MFDRPIEIEETIEDRRILSLDYLSVKEITKIIENLYGNQFELTYPTRYIYRSHGNNNSEGIGTSSVTAGQGGYDKIFFGNIYCGLYASDTEEHKVFTRFANSDQTILSGLTGAGYSGLKLIPFEEKNVITNYIEMYQQTTTNKSWFVFDGWYFRIK